MGESARDETQWLPNALSFWELHSCESCKCSMPWLERKTSTKLGSQDTTRKVLKRRCLKWPLIVHLDLICMSYDKKRFLLDSQPQIPWKGGQMRSNWNVLYTVEKIFSRAIRHLPRAFKTKILFEKNMNIKSFGTLGSLGEKWHLDVVLMEMHIIYYKERSGASSQRLWAM
jgi:hypothetical protein